MRGDISSICWWAGGTHLLVRESKYLRHGRVVHAFPLCRRELRIEPHLHLHRSLWHLGVEPRKAEGESRHVRQSRGRRESRQRRALMPCRKTWRCDARAQGIFTAASLNTCGSSDLGRGRKPRRAAAAGRAERVRDGLVRLAGLGGGSDEGGGGLCFFPFFGVRRSPS